ncbi:MAG TPA: hypothetical protein VH062_21940 [Polyangiaceae bacterium]|jgi:hypothetical protein|nr:hypothetical protein [Polyangiaceae bacterium]
MTDLSRESRELVELARDGDGPTREDRARVRRALALTLATGAASTSASAAAATKSAFAGAGIAAKGGAGTWLVMGVVAGLAGSAAVFVGVPALTHDATSKSMSHTLAAPARTPVSVETAAPTPVTALVEASPSSPTTALVAQGAPPKTNVVLRHAANTVTPTRAPVETPADVAALPDVTTPAVPSSLGAETSLLESARSALNQGNAARALALLDQHEREFPRGALVEERLATRVFALCSMGRRADAAHVAARLLALSPASPLRARVLESCAGSR